MTDYLKRSPKVTYLKVKPYTPEEIDALPNADRVWATIMAIREEAEVACNRARELGYAEGSRS